MLCLLNTYSRYSNCCEMFAKNPKSVSYATGRPISDIVLPKVILMGAGGLGLASQVGDRSGSKY